MVTSCHNYDPFYSGGIMILFYQTIFNVSIIITNSQLTDIGQTLILLVTDICDPAI